MLKDEIRKLVGYIGITNPRTNGPWVDTNKVTDQLLQIIKDRIKERIKGIIKIREEIKKGTEYTEALIDILTILDEELKT